LGSSLRAAYFCTGILISAGRISSPLAIETVPYLNVYLVAIRKLRTVPREYPGMAGSAGIDYDLAAIFYSVSSVKSLKVA
jgi:hypothetical protein